MVDSEPPLIDEPPSPEPANGPKGVAPAKAGRGDEAAAEEVVAVTVVEEEEEESPFLEDLVVLPPRQRFGTAPLVGGAAEGVVRLPPIRAEEPVASLRAALGEVKGYAQLTSYRLVLEGRPEGLDESLKKRDEQRSCGAGGKGGKGGGEQKGQSREPRAQPGGQGGVGGKGKKSKKKKGKGGSGSGGGGGWGGPNPAVAAAEDVISPFTGPGALVAVPSAVLSLEVDPSTYTPLFSADSSSSSQQPPTPSPEEEEEEEAVLDDYGDLSPLLSRGLQSGSAFRVVLERYDAAAIKDHVSRARLLLEGGAPAVEDLAEGTGGGEEEEAGEVNESEEAPGSDDGAETAIGSADADGSSVNEGEQPLSADDEARNRATTTKKKELKSAKMPSFPLDRPVPLDGSDLSDYYYLACGEEEALRAIKHPSSAEAAAAASNRGSDSSAGDVSPKRDGGEEEEREEGTDVDEEENFAVIRAAAARLNDLDRRTRVNCRVSYGGFHPPPPHRRLLGDLAYLEVTVGAGGRGGGGGLKGEETIHVTCVAAGFYVNSTRPVNNAAEAKSSGGAPYVFDPTPAEEACFSHELLDCVLKRSGALRAAWSDALAAAKERADMQAATSSSESPLRALFRVAIRGDVEGGDTRAAADGIDSVILRPSWLVPLPRGGSDGDASTWNHGRGTHEYNPARAEEDVASTFGLDVRGGSARDWNEELQSARELPRDSIQERIERARVVHKVLSDFGEAAVIGARAIFSGHITPMNPNEPTRSHVYLHNNIFFSRAVDAGVDTFKICQGDRAARKSATRDAHCIGSLHRLDVDGLHALATVLVDYLGTRLVCQSIVPGILHGEKTHTLLYGAVEATSPLSWDNGMHELLEESLGKGLMVATRRMPRMPLSEERVDAIMKLRPAQTLEHQNAAKKKGKDEEKDKSKSPTTPICGPVEAKGIKGSDQRKYLLDLTRLTPRDANWVPKSKGGTGRWEAVLAENGSSNGKSKNGSLCGIPDSLDDDEFVMSVLRTELVTSITHKKMKEWIADRKRTAADDEESKKEGEGQEKEAPKEEKPGGSEVATEGKPPDSPVEKDPVPVPAAPPPNSEAIRGKIRPEDEEHLKTLRLNVNVFLPHARSLEGIDNDAYEQMKRDEDRVREAAVHLWDEVLPSLTKEIRESAGHNVPVDGRNLTEVLHQRGINCRYLGRLAALALEEEAMDRKAEADVANAQASETAGKLPRRVMPLCWLELLECEMVARAAKHVLDSYLTENGGFAAAQPAQTISSFLSALISVREESVAETGARVSKQRSVDTVTFDEETANSLTVFETGGGGSSVRSRGKVWADIEREVGRRFRYVLTLYKNNSGSGINKMDSPSRSLYIPLLRRVCQRTGVRLAGRNYEVGTQCLCSSSVGTMLASFPIAPVDVLDVVPLVKHSAALAGEGFAPCSFDGTSGMPSLHILLPDAKATFEAAHVHWNAKALPQALDLVHEAASLYQRVVDTPLHASVARCLEMTAAILFHANEHELAAANSARALAVAVQLGGFDCHEALNGHTTLSHILISSGGLARGMKHLRACLYLMELMAGARYAELSSVYHKIGSMYHEVGSAINALRFYQEAATRSVSDRLVEGMVAKSTAFVLAGIGQFKAALETEKRAYGIYRLTLGEENDLTRNSANALRQFMKLAVEQGTRMKAADKKRREEQAADAVASQIEAAEAAEEEKKKKKKPRKRKKKN